MCIEVAAQGLWGTKITGFSLRGVESSPRDKSGDNTLVPEVTRLAACRGGQVKPRSPGGFNHTPSLLSLIFSGLML